ncbi:MAG: hypothetical protein CMO30_01645 [Tistrella sp.]|uniref:DUF262 domain-containing protein n=1 Tax=Tistrella mobilis TaxID=171437 RepID=A0A3B9IQB1_9PROT|nr:hypothetical protein [Tistrella sp.]MBA73980.1 hypothetical protein [Tistrella sp.]HAE50064.1 DUF262 domain-containing protein [Tistrella mobilis]
MEASPANVIQYFNGEKQNIIPLFQRRYSWNKQNWQALWDDMLVQYDAEDRTSHFMGAIVSVPARSVPVGVNKYLIIDGQQRLTTVSLLLAALRDSVDENSAARIQEVYLTNRFRGPDDTLKFVPTQADRDCYTSLILQRENPSDGSLMSDAYKFFRDKLAKGVDLNGDPIDCAKVLETVEHALQVVMINLGDADDPYLIFESLNFKGQPLTQADLVRNYILMRFRHSISPNGEQERIYKKYWAPMEEQLGGGLTEFLRHYAMKDGENVYQTGIYAATKSRLRNLSGPESVEAEVARMHEFSSMYSTILNPEGEQSAAVRKRLENIKNLDVGTSYPLLLRLLDARRVGAISDDELDKCLSLIEAFIIRRSICQVPTNALNKLFLSWAKQFPTENYVAWLHSAMSAGQGGRRFPSDADFRNSFVNDKQYGRGSTHFVLIQLERFSGHREPADLEHATIEHIMPQTLSERWQQDLGPTATEVHQRLLHTFGNLTLTGYNAELSNLSFQEKKVKLEKTHIELNRGLLNLEKWGEAEIQARADEMFEVAARLWPGPLASQTRG